MADEQPMVPMMEMVSTVVTVHGRFAQDIIVAACRATTRSDSEHEAMLVMATAIDRVNERAAEVAEQGGRAATAATIREMHPPGVWVARVEESRPS